MIKSNYKFLYSNPSNCKFDGTELDVSGSDVRQRELPGSSPRTDALNDARTMERYATMTGRRAEGLEGIGLWEANEMFHRIGRDQVVISYPVSRDMNHMVNVQGAYRRTITYPRGGTSSTIRYLVLDNGRRVSRPASFFVSQHTNIFWLR